MRISSASARGLLVRAGVVGLAAVSTGLVGAALAALDAWTAVVALGAGLLGAGVAAAALLLAGKGHPLSLHREVVELRRTLDAQSLRHAEATNAVRADLLALSERTETDRPRP